MTFEMLEMLFEVFWESELKLHYHHEGPGQLFSPLPELSKLDKNEFAALKPKVREVFCYFFVYLSNEKIEISDRRMMFGNGWTPLSYLLNKYAKLNEEARALKGSLRYMQRKQRARERKKGGEKNENI